MSRTSSIRLDGRNIPCRDVISVKMVSHEGEHFTEFVYHSPVNPGFTCTSLVPREKAYALELKVRKTSPR